MPVRIVVSLLIQLIAFLIGVIGWRKLILPYRLVVLQVGAAIVCQYVTIHFAAVLGQQNSWIFNIYLLIELVLLGLSGILFVDDKRFKVVMTLALGCLIIYWIVTAITTDFMKLFNWFVVYSSVFLVFLFIVVLFKSAMFQFQKIYFQPLFILCTSLIIYYGCIVPLFGIINNLFITDMIAAKQLYFINHLVIFIRYALVAVAFYLYGRQAKKGLAKS